MVDVKTLKIPSQPLDIKLLSQDKEAIPKIRKSLEGIVGGRVNAKDYKGNGHWEFPEQMGNGIGFIYAIINLINGRCYIGKKLYKSTGKLTKGKETNWRWYISSSKELDADIREQYKQGFRFICLEEYKSKGALSWSETWSICYVKAPENIEKWYNTLINKVSWKVKEKISERHLNRLNLLINNYYHDTKNI